MSIPNPNPKMPKWASNILTALAGVAVGLFAMWMMQRCSTQPIEPIVLHDSIAVHDTLRIAGKTHTLYVRDTLYVQRTDTQYIDTLLYAAKEYRDTFATDTSRIELAVAFSGYNAKIDSVGLNYTLEVQPRVVREKKGWGWCVMPSVQVGYGVALGQPIIAAPYIGVGVSVGWGYTWRK